MSNETNVKSLEDVLGLVHGLTEKMKAAHQKSELAVKTLKANGFKEHDLCRVHNALQLIHESMNTLATLHHLCANHGQLSSGLAALALAQEIHGATTFICDLQDKYSIDLSMDPSNREGVLEVIGEIEAAVEKAKVEKAKDAEKAIFVENATATVQ